MTVKLPHDVARLQWCNKKSLGLELHDRVQTPISLMYIFYKVVGFRRSGHNYFTVSRQICSAIQRSEKISRRFPLHTLRFTVVGVSVFVASLQYVWNPRFISPIRYIPVFVLSETCLNRFNVTENKGM